MKPVARKAAHYRPGTFCWAELATPDMNGSLEFYRALFGWGRAETPSSQGHQTLHIDGADVAAFHASAEPSRHAEARWLVYVASPDVDEAVMQTIRHGGELVTGPEDVHDDRRLALVKDPTGAVLGLWQSKGHGGAQIANQPGTICWCELVTDNTDRAARFFQRLLRWSTQVQDLGHLVYTTFLAGDVACGGMYPMDESWAGETPYWTPYFRVRHCETTVETAVDHGADVKIPPTVIPGLGRFSLLADPQGALFSVMTLNRPS